MAVSEHVENVGAHFGNATQIALISIGTHKHKAELLPSIRTLHYMGYKLYATLSTADFYNESGTPVEDVVLPFFEKESTPTSHQ